MRFLSTNRDGYIGHWASAFPNQSDGDLEHPAEEKKESGRTGHKPIAPATRPAKLAQRLGESRMLLAPDTAHPDLAKNDHSSVGAECGEC